MQQNSSIDEVDKYVTETIDEIKKKSNNTSISVEDIDKYYEFDISKNHNDYNVNQEIFNLNNLKISASGNNINTNNSHNNDDDEDDDRNYDNTEKNMYKQNIIEKCNAINVLKIKPTIDPKNVQKYRYNDNDKNNNSYNKENANDDDIEIDELSRKQIQSSTQDKIDLILQKNKLDLKETREKLAMASLISIVSVFITLYKCVQT
jgi:hypothetical protein